MNDSHQMFMMLWRELQNNFSVLETKKKWCTIEIIWIRAMSHYHDGISSRIHYRPLPKNIIRNKSLRQENYGTIVLMSRECSIIDMYNTTSHDEGMILTRTLLTYFNECERIQCRKSIREDHKKHRLLLSASCWTIFVISKEKCNKKYRQKAISKAYRSNDSPIHRWKRTSQSILMRKIDRKSNQNETSLIMIASNYVDNLMRMFHQQSIDEVKYRKWIISTRVFFCYFPTSKTHFHYIEWEKLTW